MRRGLGLGGPTWPARLASGCLNSKQIQPTASQAGHKTPLIFFPYMRKTSDVAEMAFFAKKNWRKIWPKNGLKWPKIAKIWPNNGLKWPKIA